MPDQLQQLADRVRADLAGTRTPQGRWSSATLMLLEYLCGAVAAEGHPRRLAEAAVTGWLLTGEPIRGCIASEVELGFWKLPRPQQGQQGFGAGWGAGAPRDGGGQTVAEAEMVVAADRARADAGGRHRCGARRRASGGRGGARRR